MKEYRRKKLRPNADLADVPRKIQCSVTLWKFQGSKAGVLGQSSRRSEMIPVRVVLPASWLNLGIFMHGAVTVEGAEIRLTRWFIPFFAGFYISQVVRRIFVH